MKKIKLTFLGLICALLLALVGFANVGVKATVATDANITLKGAQIRTTEPVGLRFVADTTNLEATDVTAYGIVLAFGKTADATNFVLGGNINGKTVINGEVAAVNETTKQYTVTLIDIPETMYVQEISARAYYKKGEVVTYSNDIITKSAVEGALAAKNSGNNDIAINNIVEYVGQNYKKSYVNADGNFMVDAAVYEYDYKELAKQFLNDYNRVMNTSIASINDIAYELMGSYGDGQTLEKVQNTNIYKFFKANNNEMLNKWKFLLDYLAVNTGNDFVKIQVGIIEGTSESYKDWWGGRHISAQLQGFLSKSRCTSTAFHSLDYSDPANAKHYEILKTQKIVTTRDINTINFAKPGEVVKLPAAANAEVGYEFTGYTCNGNLLVAESDYTVTADNAEFVATFAPIEYNAKFFDGEKELNELTLTYNVESALIELPAYSKEGYTFDGWFDNANCEGTAITSIDAGTIGNKVFYAKLLKTEMVKVDVTYDLNGGDWNISEMRENNKFDHFVGGSFNSINWSTYKNYINVTNSSRGNWFNIGLTATAIPGVYEVKAHGNQGAVDGTGKYDYYLVYHTDTVADIRNYCKAIKLGQLVYLDNIPTSSSKNASITIDIFASGASKVTVNKTYLLETVLPTPYKAGFVFKGWLCSVDNKVYTKFPGYTTNPGKITYTAQWEAAK